MSPDVIYYLPTLNACMNLLAFCCLCLGWVAIKKKDQNRHRQWMLRALFFSFIFLVSYLVYHASAEPVSYARQGFMRYVYYFILITHVPLAGGIVPFVGAAVYFAARKQFDRHKRVTRILWPVWAYVSVTGVLIYLMLYGPL